MAASSSSTTTDAGPKTVLVVASPYDGEVLRGMLARAGYETTVSDGTDAPDQHVERAHPVAVVLSLRLLGVDALELLRQIRGGAAGGSTPVLLVGDASLRMTLGDAVRLGANQLVIRPLEADLLLAKLGSVVATRTGIEGTGPFPAVSAAGTTGTGPLPLPDLRRGSPDSKVAAAGERFEGDDSTWCGGDTWDSLIAAAEQGRWRGATEVIDEGDVTRQVVEPEQPEEPEPEQPEEPEPEQPEEPEPEQPEPEQPEPEQPEPEPEPEQPEPEPEQPEPEQPEQPEPLDASADESLSPLHRELQREVDAADRRLFPQATQPFQLLEDEDEDFDTLDDIDLDQIGVDTFPGAGADEPTSTVEPSTVEVAVVNAPSTVEAPAADAPSAAPQSAAPVSAAPVSTGAPLLELSGELASQDLAGLLGRVKRTGFTGRLVCRRDEVEKSVYFEDGHAVFAASNEPHDRLVHLLFREAKIQPADLEACEAEVQAGRRIGAVLVERGLIKADELFPLVRRHVADVIYSLFTWSAGRYELRGEAPLPEERIRLEIHPWALIGEGIRRKLGLDRLEELVGAGDTQVELCRGVDVTRALETAGLAAPERELAGLLDGPIAVAQLVERAGDALRVYQLVYTLLAIGAARLCAQEDADERAERRAHDRAVAIDRRRLQAKQAQVREADYHTLLGVARDASGYEIGLAYERVRAELDPAALPAAVAEEQAEALAEICEVVDEAFRILGDPALRAAYRESLRRYGDGSR